MTQPSVDGRQSSVGSRRSAVVTVWESEALAAAVLVLAATAMFVAWVADGAGLPIHPTAVLVLALAATAAFLSFTRRRVSFAGRRVAAFMFIVCGFTCYVGWLAWPSLLPIAQGPDLVHHLTLIHFIQERHALPHDPRLGAHMGEMAGYTPGSHLLAALVGEWFRADAIRVVHPVQAVSVGLKAGFIYCALMRLLRSASGASVAGALAGTLLLLLPYRYLLEPITVFGFYSQVIAELFAVAILWLVVVWHQHRWRGWLALAGLFGVGIVLSWPVYFPVVALAIAVVVAFHWRMGVRPRGAVAGDLLTALGPAVLTATIFSWRHASSAGVLRSGGSVTVPNVDAFGWGFLLLTVGGVVLAVRRPRRRLPVLAFAAACLAQIVALATAQTWLRATNLYLASKTVSLLVYPLAILGALALAFLTRPLAAARGAPVKLRATSILAAPLIVGVLLLFRGLPVRPLDSPISEPVYRAGLWAKAHLPASCVDYMVEHWLTGYWLHLDVLGNPRASERMRNETFEYRRAVSRWILPGGPPFAIVEDLTAVPADARRTMQVLHEAGAAAVVKRTDDRGTCGEPPPPQVGR